MTTPLPADDRITVSARSQGRWRAGRLNHRDAQKPFANVMQLGKDAIQALPSAVWWLPGPIAWRQETQLISASRETPIDAHAALGQ